jgi:hypothetical protein
VSGSEVSGNVVVTSTVVGAVTSGSASAAPATAAGGCGLVGCGGVVDALAPEGLAVAWVLAALDGIARSIVVGDNVLGLVVTDAPPDELGGLAFTVVGALT